MSKKECCGTCQYGSYDEMLGYVCVNDDSDYCADFVGHGFCCEDWEDKE